MVCLISLINKGIISINDLYVANIFIFKALRNPVIACFLLVFLETYYPA